MPRRARIDTPGALHHIMVRGIERRNIFLDDEDRLDFMQRMSALLTETHTECYGWALMSNHFHVLFQTGDVPVATVMRRLLTGYAVRFNHRHKRHGVLFQNRYKSILCQKESYLLELVRYIHLNPLRAGLVKDLKELDRFAYSGHAALIGKIPHTWQNTAFVLAHFSQAPKQARKLYRAYMEGGIGRERPDLIGGGLRRSLKGWSEGSSKDSRVKGDERILGDSDFVQQTLAQADEHLERQIKLRMRGYDINQLARHVEKVLDVPEGTIFAHGRFAEVVQARSLFYYWAARELGMKVVDIARKFDQTPSTISIAVRRGERLAKEMGYAPPG